ncbi:MAG: Mur ligase family protein [Alistipes indistinctus]
MPIFLPRSQHGAAAVVCGGASAERPVGVTFVQVPDSTVALGQVASAFYGHPSRRLKLVGVTGTNGKTTTATLLYRMFRRATKPGWISTVVYCVDDREIPSTHTTPDSIRLNAMMAEMVEAGCDYCFMEVSSHSLVQHRTAGLAFVGGIFSNITHDHLDYHKTFAEYIRAKKLFSMDCPPGLSR